MAKRLYLILIATLGISGCVISPRRDSTTNPNPGTSGGQLYVSTAGSILRYSNALKANGNVAPDVTISGTSSRLNSPRRILLDVNTDRLFVANSGGGSVLVFSSASKATAGTAPSVVLTSTGNLSSPVDVAIDAGANLLYVADGSNIFVFANQSQLSGNVNTAPVRTITFTFTIGAIFLDASNNRMFIADPTDGVIDILPGASSASGQAAQQLSGVISGSATTLSQPEGMALDSGGRLIVSNGGSSPGILIFSNLVIPSGDSTTPPDATISGTSTKVASPGHLILNSRNSGELYVADAQAPGILIFSNVNNLKGNITSAPARSIIGSGTLLNANAVNGIALDTTR